jgi:hypothetical protein
MLTIKPHRLLNLFSASVGHGENLPERISPRAAASSLGTRPCRSHLWRSALPGSPGHASCFPQRERTGSASLEPSNYRRRHDDQDNEPDDHHDRAEDHSVPGHHSPRLHGVSSKSPTLDSDGCGKLHRQTGRPPLRIPLFKPEGFETALAQLGDRLVGEHAIGPAAVGDDRPVAGQFP